MDYGEVVAAQHFNIDGIVTVKKMPGVKTSDVKVTLTINGAQKIATRIKPTGEFTLLDVPPGYHHLETFALGYTFPPLRLRITSDGGRECHFAEDVDEAVHVNPLVLSPVSVAEYFEPRGGLSVGALMKNPMFLMVAFTVVMAFYMPKMMESMDPEALKEMQEQMGNPPSLADMFGGGERGREREGDDGRGTARGGGGEVIEKRRERRSEGSARGCDDNPIVRETTTTTTPASGRAPRRSIARRRRRSAPRRRRRRRRRRRPRPRRRSRRTRNTLTRRIRRPDTSAWTSG